tara:strand:- start:381 stop:1301 length:921 start_codon:yes stop_codon:yes gene_type:complete
MINYNLIRENYLNGKYEKHTYIKKMHQLHKHLFFFPNLIKNSDIHNIDINQEGVVATLDCGMKLYLDENDSRFIPIEILNFGKFEDNEKEVIEYISSSSRVIADIGANIGYYTLKFSQSKSVKKIYSFEAIPRTYNILKKHIKLNHCEKALLLNKAISNTNEKKDFYWTKLETGSSSMKNIQNRKKINRVSVDAITFDSYFWEKKIEIDFIKCDVEGSELFVFQGATSYLRDYKPIIFCELLRKWSKKFNYSPNEVISLICNYGYNCYQLNKNKLRKIRKITDKTVNTNFFFMHPNRHKKFINKFK